MSESEAEFVRERLKRFIGMYEGIDTGPGDPVHAVRKHARELLASEPTADDLFTIADEIAVALSQDRRAVSLGAHWQQELERIREQESR